MNGSLTDELHVFRDTQLQTLGIAQIRCKDDCRLAPEQWRGGFRLLVAHKGKGELQVNDERYQVLPCFYYLLPVADSVRLMLSADSLLSEICFRVSDEELLKVVKALPVRGACSPKDAAELLHGFDLSCAAAGSAHPIIMLRLDTVVKNAILSIAHSYWAQHPEAEERTTVRQRSGHPFPIAAYIQEHSSERLTLESISKKFGFHPHYIIKMFNEQIGMSPIQYLQEVRLLKGMEYLESTDMTVAEISEHLGWTTSYFSRLFHQRKGLSPSQFRKSQTSACAAGTASC